MNIVIFRIEYLKYLLFKKCVLLNLMKFIKYELQYIGCLINVKVSHTFT